MKTLKNFKDSTYLLIKLQSTKFEFMIRLFSPSKNLIMFEVFVGVHMFEIVYRNGETRIEHNNTLFQFSKPRSEHNSCIKYSFQWAESRVQRQSLKTKVPPLLQSLMVFLVVQCFLTLSFFDIQTIFNNKCTRINLLVHRNFEWYVVTLRPSVVPIEKRLPLTPSLSLPLCAQRRRSSVDVWRRILLLVQPQRIGYPELSIYIICK